MIQKMSDNDALRQFEVDGQAFAVDVHEDRRDRATKLYANVTLPVNHVDRRFSVTVIYQFNPAPDVDYQFQTYVHVLEPPDAQRRLLIYCNEVFSATCDDVTAAALNLSRLISVHVRGV